MENPARNARHATQPEKKKQRRRVKNSAQTLILKQKERLAPKQPS
jgi:hypothetical protein